MIDDERVTASALDMSQPTPELILYSRPGCGLCDEARDLLLDLLSERRRLGKSVPALVERDIGTNPTWDRAYFTTIPVVELGGRQVELATSLSKVRALLATLDVDAPSADAAAAARSR
jgi:hypothetical protein